MATPYKLNADWARQGVCKQRNNTIKNITRPSAAACRLGATLMNATTPLFCSDNLAAVWRAHKKR